MRLLLDTHTFLWFVEGDAARLPSEVRALIEDGENDVRLSIVSLWEMAIKISLGRLRLAEPFEILIPRLLKTNQIALLEVTVPHLTLIATMPFHHRDPFDRLLIAQAQVEGLLIVSADAAFDAYPVTRLWRDRMPLLPATEDQGAPDNSSA